MILSDGRSIPESVEIIVRQVAAAYGTSPQEIFGNRRGYPVIHARFEAMWRARREIRINRMPPSFPHIGKWFNRDHTSVQNAVKRHEGRATKSQPKVIRIRQVEPADFRHQLACDLAEAAA